MTCSPQSAQNRIRPRKFGDQNEVH